MCTVLQISLHVTKCLINHRPYFCKDGREIDRFNCLAFSSNMLLPHSPKIWGPRSLRKVRSCCASRRPFLTCMDSPGYNLYLSKFYTETCHLVLLLPQPCSYQEIQKLGFPLHLVKSGVELSNSMPHSMGML